MPSQDKQKPPPTDTSSGLTYEKAGVSIAAAESAIELIKPLAEATRTPQVLTGVGPFAASFLADFSDCREPVLVASTDGVGTKVKLAAIHQRYQGVGRDLVAVCANDILTTGATPLFFLDYIACHRVEPAVIEELVTGMRDACIESAVALIGGEIAEMRDLYAPGEFDLAGFAIGVVDRNQLISGDRITIGDRLLALPSSGIHSNGLTLARRVFEGLARDDWERSHERLGCSLVEELLKPTRIYAHEMKALRGAAADVKGAVHISGGGIPDNLSRILPPGTSARVNKALLPRLPIFELIAERGNIEPEEMWRTFNMGVGMVLAFSPEEAEAAEAISQAQGFSLLDVGEVVPGNQRVIIT